MNPFLPALCAVAMLVLGCDGGPPTVDDPEQAAIVTEDIPRFWKAFDKGGDLEEAFEDEYFDNASLGLDAFITRRIQSPSHLASKVNQTLRYYTSIRANSLRLAEDPAAVEPIRQAYRKIKQLYPVATFPPTYLLVGRFNAVGTIDRAGLLIGTEFFSLAAESPTSEFSAGLRDKVLDPSYMAALVAQEHVNFLQAKSSALYQRSNKTLLEQSLLEGSATFVAELTTGVVAPPALPAHGDERERELWLEFKAAMDGTDLSRWLYNADTIEDRPADLGGYVGYRICKAYYEQAADKTEAVAAIIGLGDAKQFLAESGYEALVLGE